MWPFQNFYHYEEQGNNNVILKYLNKKINIKKKIFNNIHYIAPSNWIKNKALKQKINKNKITKIYNSFTIKTKGFENYKQIKNLSKIKKFNILLFGSASPFDDKRKNFDEVLKSIGILKEKILNLKVVVFGKYNKEFDNNDIFQVGYLNIYELKYLYSISKVLLLTSKQDNLPNVILEALSCGLPVCSIGEGGQNEIIVNNYNGYKLTDLKSKSNLNKIRECIQDNKRFSYNSKIYAKKNFDYRVIAREHLKLYNKIISK